MFISDSLVETIGKVGTLTSWLCFGVSQATAQAWSVWLACLVSVGTLIVMTPKIIARMKAGWMLLRAKWRAIADWVRNWGPLIAITLLLWGLTWLNGCVKGSSSTLTTAPSATATKVEERTKYDEAGKAIETLRTTLMGQATGTSAKAHGDKIDQQLASQPANVSVNGISASGGGGESDTTAKSAPSLWSNPLLWVGILCVLGAAAAFWLGLRRAAIVLLIVGGGLIAAALYPWLMLFAVAGVVAVQFGPHLYAEFQARRNHEALRAVAAGVDALDADDYVKVTGEIAKHADAADKAVIRKVRRADGLA